MHRVGFHRTEILCNRPQTTVNVQKGELQAVFVNLDQWESAAENAVRRLSSVEPCARREGSLEVTLKCGQH